MVCIYSSVIIIKISFSDNLNVSNVFKKNTSLWHLRLDHINKPKMNRMSKGGLIS